VIEIMVNGRKVRFLSLAGSVQSDSVERHANLVVWRNWKTLHKSVK